MIWAARTIHRKLLDLRIKHMYEEFDDTHSFITYRYDVSLPRMYRALRG